MMFTCIGCACCVLDTDTGTERTFVLSNKSEKRKSYC